MPGLIEKNAKIQLTMKQVFAVVDGKTTYTEFVCSGMVFDFTQSDFDYFGTVKSGKVFLVAPLERPPSLPGQIVHDGVAYEIKGIKTYRNIKGVILGYRIAAAGA
ncbi:MAG: hypothetical protein PHI85_04960 [Victivallaceae bacterium]|nr:hypothetical protein [Victivallaceae bacterium]